MAAVDDIEIEMSIILGTTSLPIRQILGMSRGAMIALDAGQDDPSQVIVNGKLVARGQIHVDEERMSLEITEVVKRGG